MTRQTQINTANQLLAQNLSTLTFEQLVNLCLVKKANPTALPSFGRSLQAELIRRYDEQAITQNPAEFAVLQNFANTFADPVGEFEHALRTMHTQINKDVWFNNNREYFIRIINDLTGVKVLIDNQELLASGVHNAIARAMILDSYPLIEAVVVNSTAFELLLSPPSVWQEIANSQNTMTIFAKSSQIIERIINTDIALQAVVKQNTAITAIINSNNALNTAINSLIAMSAIAQSQIAMSAIAQSQIAMSAIAQSQIAMTIVINNADFKNAFFANNSNFQVVRNELYEMAKAHWTRQAHTYQDVVSSANNAMAQKVGLVFACLGYYGNKTASKTSMNHSNNTLAVTASSSSSPTSMLSLDGVSFDKATFTESGDGYVYCELWTPKN